MLLKKRFMIFSYFRKINKEVKILKEGSNPIHTKNPDKNE
jgi:hypothetical protein